MLLKAHGDSNFCCTFTVESKGILGALRYVTLI